MDSKPVILCDICVFCKRCTLESGYRDLIEDGRAALQTKYPNHDFWVLGPLCNVFEETPTN